MSAEEITTDGGQAEEIAPDGGQAEDLATDGGHEENVGEDNDTATDNDSSGDSDIDNHEYFVWAERFVDANGDNLKFYHYDSRISDDDLITLHPNIRDPHLDITILYEATETIVCVNKPNHI